MALSTRDKIIVLAVLVAVAVFLVVNSMTSTTTVDNYVSLTYSGSVQHEMQPEEEFGSQSTNSSSLSRKFITRDSAPEGTYKFSSYTEGNRTKPLDDLNRFFEGISPLEGSDNGVHGID